MRPLRQGFVTDDPKDGRRSALFNQNGALLGFKMFASHQTERQDGRVTASVIRKATLACRQLPQCGVSDGGFGVHGSKSHNPRDSRFTSAPCKQDLAEVEARGVNFGQWLRETEWQVNMSRFPSSDGAIQGGSSGVRATHEMGAQCPFSLFCE
jgi:hypothetical protein